MFAFPYGKANNALLLWRKAIIYIFLIVYGVNNIETIHYITLYYALVIKH